jgi:hypothetical protein
VLTIDLDRMHLLIHLLRLRPTPEELKSYQRNDQVENLVMTHKYEGWTAFLKKLTPKNVFDGLEPERPGMRKLQEQLLGQLFDVAEVEEDYLNDARGTTTGRYRQ